jgi:hypothetical protein
MSTSKLIRRVLFIIGLMLLPSIAVTQTKGEKPPSRKEQEKNAAKQEKEGLKAQEKAKKEYKKRQSKTTKKSMKANKKRSNRNRGAKGEPFYKKWFRRG